MKKLIRLLCTILCLSLFFTSSTFAQSNTSVDILRAYVADGYAVATCRIASPSNGSITVKCDNTDGTTVYITQLPMPNQSVFEFSFPLTQQHFTDDLVLFVGGTNIQTPAKIKFNYKTPVSESPYLYLAPNVTVSNLKSELTANAPAFFRSETPLNDNDILVSGDTIEVELLSDNMTVDMAFTALVLGDIDCDGTVTASDALMILQNAVGKIELEGYILDAAKTDRTDTVSANCALLALQYAVGKITVL